MRHFLAPVEAHILPSVFFQGKLTKLNHEHRDLKEKLKEERKQVEELWKTKAELEDERRLQDRAVEQLQRKVRAGLALFIGPNVDILHSFGAKRELKICCLNPEATRDQQKQLIFLMRGSDALCPISSHLKVSLISL